MHFNATVGGKTQLLELDIVVHFKTVEKTPLPTTPKTRNAIVVLLAAAAADAWLSAVEAAADDIVLDVVWIRNEMVSPMTAL